MDWSSPVIPPYSFTIVTTATTTQPNITLTDPRRPPTYHRFIFWFCVSRLLLSSFVAVDVGGGLTDILSFQFRAATELNYRFCLLLSLAPYHSTRPPHPSRLPLCLTPKCPARSSHTRCIIIKPLHMFRSAP